MMIPVISIAPMIQWTDRHYRMLMRNITKHTLLYTEMVMDDAITRNLEHLERYIGHSNIEHPLAIQLGGKNIEKLTYATQICDQYSDFTHINLNCGCPSNKALSAGFGAELMCEDPEYIRQLLSSMCRVATNAEVTVKCRIGTTPSRTDNGVWEDLVGFVEAVKAAGVKQIVVHARSCVLKGLSPAQNRTIPPLQYDMVYRLLETYPELSFILNGGIKTHEQIDEFLSIDSSCNSNENSKLAFRGVMIGRQAYNYPWTFRGIDRKYYPIAHADDGSQLTRYEVIENYLDYCNQMQNEKCFGATLQTLVKPLHNIFAGCPMKRSRKGTDVHLEEALSSTEPPSIIYDVNHNRMYKQKLDQLVKEYCKSRERGYVGHHSIDYSVDVREIVHTAIEDTIPDEFYHG